jgi:hypothetical protein
MVNDGLNHEEGGLNYKYCTRKSDFYRFTLHRKRRVLFVTTKRVEEQHFPQFHP